MGPVRLIGSLVLVLVLAIPAAASEDDAPTPLLEAVAFSPPGANPAEVMFTDWAQMKEFHGGAGITSASPLQERQRLMLDIVRSEASTMEFGLDRLGEWSESWGWDNTDLDWEARLPSEHVVLRFGEHWDSQPFRDALEGFGYHARDLGGFTHYRPGDEAESPSRLLLRRGSPQTQVAISDDGRTVVIGWFGGIKQVMRAGLRADRAEVAASPYGRAAAALGEPMAAHIFDGRDSCGEIWNEFLSGDAHEVAASVAPLHPYVALAAGYSRAGAAPSPEGRFVFGYARPWQAREDLPGRRLLVEEGYYADVAFALADARVDGTELILDVEPLGGVPKLVLDFRRNPLFTMCGPVPDQPA